MAKNKDEVLELFDTLSGNFIHYALISRSDEVTPTIHSKEKWVYESGHLVDIHSKVDILTQKLDQILFVGWSQVSTFTPLTQ